MRLLFLLHFMLGLIPVLSWINSCSEKSGLQHISMLKLTKSLIRWRKNVQKCYFSLAMFVFSRYLSDKVYTVVS